MKDKELLRTLKFVLFSISAGVIQLGGFALLNELLQLDYWLSYLIALVASVLWNFTFNRKYTFRSDGHVGRAMALVFAYYCVFTPVTVWLEYYLTKTLLWNEYLVTGINMLLNVSTEYLYQRFVVYRKSMDTNDLVK